MDSGAVSDVYPGGSCGAGPAPGGGGVTAGIWSGGIAMNPYGSWAWCQNIPEEAQHSGPRTRPYTGFWISGTGGSPTGGGAGGGAASSMATAKRVARVVEVRREPQVRVSGGAEPRVLRLPGLQAPALPGRPRRRPKRSWRPSRMRWRRGARVGSWVTRLAPHRRVRACESRSRIRYATAPSSAGGTRRSPRLPEASAEKNGAHPARHGRVNDLQATNQAASSPIRECCRYEVQGDCEPRQRLQLPDLRRLMGSRYGRRRGGKGRSSRSWSTRRVWFSTFTNEVPDQCIHLGAGHPRFPDQRHRTGTHRQGTRRTTQGDAPQTASTSSTESGGSSNRPGREASPLPREPRWHMHDYWFGEALGELSPAPVSGCRSRSSRRRSVSTWKTNSLERFPNPSPAETSSLTSGPRADLTFTSL